MRRAHVLLGALLAMGLLAGCVDTTVTTEVGTEGDIDQLDVELEMDPGTYGLFQEAAQENGYNSTEEWLSDGFYSDFDEDEIGEQSVTTTPPQEREGDDQYLITMSASDVDVDALEGVETTVEEGTLRFEDNSVGSGDGGDPDSPEDIDGVGDAAGSVATLEYVVIMPGQIEETNADQVTDDGTTATWRLHEDQPDEGLYAESSVDNSTPGFGTGAALVGVLLSVALLGRRFGRE